MAAEIKIVADVAALNRFAAEEFQRLALAAVSKYGRFSVALSGGNTPRSIYSLLAQECKTSVPWDKVHIFFGDERHVPPDHPDSNFRMANESLLSRVPIPEKNVHRIRAELDATACADEYEQQLKSFFSPANRDWPRFDLIFLGLGDDGHTASLFPGSRALEENSRWVVANWVEKFQTFRITFTFPVLNHGAEVVFVVSGESKAKMLAQILQPHAPPSFPAQRVQPQDGRLLWLCDQAAANLLPSDISNRS